MRWLAALPALAGVLAVSIIGSCVYLARSHGHIPSWLDFPPISLAGIHEPERTVYAIGFIVIVACFFFMEAVYVSALEPGLTDDGKATASTADWVARVGFVLLGVQGVIPLQGMGSIGQLVHVMSANLFFLAAIYHAYQVLSLLMGPNATASPISRANDPVGWHIKTVVIVLALFPSLPAMLLHPGNANLAPHEYAQQEQQMETAGFSQWWMVGSIIAYFMLYSRDLSILLRHAAVVEAKSS